MTIVFPDLFSLLAKWGIIQRAILQTFLPLPVWVPSMYQVKQEGQRGLMTSCHLPRAKKMHKEDLNAAADPRDPSFILDSASSSLTESTCSESFLWSFLLYSQVSSVRQPTFVWPVFCLSPSYRTSNAHLSSFWNKAFLDIITQWTGLCSTLLALLEQNTSHKAWWFPPLTHVSRSYWTSESTPWG